MQFNILASIFSCLRQRGKLAAALSDAQVDLNPYQIEAASFAFRNPFSKGANLPEKLERQLEAKRTEAWKAYDLSFREIEQQKDAVLDEVSRRMQQRIESSILFTLRWRVD